VVFWESVQDSPNVAGYELYLKKYPAGEFVELARWKIEQLRKTVAETPAAGLAGVPAEKASAAAGPAFPLQGTVVEAHSGGGYTYILLNTATGQYWVATAVIEVSAGEKIGFANGNVLRDFPSKYMNRTFPEIIYSDSVIGKTPSIKPAAPAEPTAAASGSIATAVKAEMPPSTAAPAIAPAMQGSGPNAYNVGELFAKSADLSGKIVVLRAKVVKVANGILGKSWLHVQDGTGDAMKNTHDLVVTTAATPNKGDTVTLEGKVVTNRDFGYGYVYPVVVEDAVLK
jgi:hypothetical protein